MAASPWQYFREAPPISKTIAAGAFFLSLLVYTRVFPHYYFSFIPQKFLQLPPELWRLFTPFFLTGGGLSILFTPYFLYRYGAQLEIASPRFSQRADFITYICFACLIILGLNILIGGNSLASPLFMAFMTTSTIDSWDVPVTLFGFVTIPSQYLPYLFVTCGPNSALIQGTGLVAAHVYDFLTGLYPHCGGPSHSFITTPEWMRKFFGTRGEVARPYSTVLNANAASGSTSNGVRASA